MPSAKWDADGNEMTFAYDSSNLFLNKITYTDTSFEVPQYDDTTGLLLSNTDVNNNTTSYTYDPMRRLLTVGYPDGGAEGLTYVDTVGSLSVTFTKTINGGSSTVPALSSLGVSYSAAALTKVALADGLGRLTETELTDPNEASLGNRPIQVDTTYDLLGRVATVTNPYKRTTESTYGITTYTYDALGRKAIIKNWDNSIKQACFNGISTVGQFCQSNVPGAPAAWEDDTDENDNTWQRLQNGLGQMSYVYEPNGSSQTSTMETNYIYDVLGNLLHAYQYGQAGVDTQLEPRSFHYDTLSRLTSASNPESGTDTYTYDANGNVLSKTSPAINSGTGTQTLYYAYDCMNRLVSKWIGTAPALPGCTVTSPTVTAALLDTYNYGYTGVGGNAVGRLTSEHAYNNSTLVDKRTNIAYDTMGRLAFENQVPYSPTGTIYPFTYTYDLAGNPITASNGLVASNQQAPCTSTGASDLCFNFAYDAADRLQIAATTSQPSAWTPAANYPPLLLQANPVTTTAFGSSVIDEPYDAMGHLANAQLSLATATSSAQLKIARTYDDRGRITSELDGSYGKRTSATTSTGQIDIAGTYVSPDTGSVVLTFSGGAITTPVSTVATLWSASLNATPGTLAASVVSAINTTTATSTYVTASLAADGTTILLNSTSTYTGTTANFNVAATVTDTAGLTPSYSAATTDMAGGLPAVTTAYGSIYSYLVPAGGYAPNGNLLAHDDSVTGPWAYSYDTLNRLTGASSGAASGAYYAGNTGCWTYDGFGNRTIEAFSNVNPTPCASDTNDQIYNSRTYVNNSYTNNRISNPNFAKYDSAGDTIADQENNYLYDPEGRICATQSTVSGSPWYQYLYDAEGLRVGKAQITGTPTSCASPTSDGYGTGSTGQTEYLLDLAGEQITELLVSSAGVVTPQHSNLYVGSHLLATYDFAGTGAPSLHFPFNDPLGTKRIQASPTGAAELNCFSLPFGNDTPYSRLPNCPNLGSQTAPDDTEQHFTGKERDTESGNDYFGARYYASWMGRFESPDSGKVTSAHLADPQKWNMYAYVVNNPFEYFDPDGQAEVTVIIRAFIPAARFKFPPVVGPNVHGDDRHHEMYPKSYRVEMKVTFETDPSKVKNGNPIISAGPPTTTGSSTDYFGHTYTGTAKLNYSASGTYKDGSAVVSFHVDGADPNFPSGSPPVSGSFTVKVPTAGDQLTLSGTVTPFPAWEGYAFVSGGGGPQSILQTENSLGSDDTPASLFLGESRSVASWANLSNARPEAQTQSCTQDGSGGK
jgi:RHS repeat-associated protein